MKNTITIEIGQTEDEYHVETEFGVSLGELLAAVVCMIHAGEEVDSDFGEAVKRAIDDGFSGAEEYAGE